MDELEEAEEEHPPPHDIPLHSYFLQIRELLETKSITPSTGKKDCLYDLSIALTDCVLFLEKRKMKINKDSSQGQGQRQDHYSLPELWFLCKTKRKLIHIKKKLFVATSHPVVPEQTSLSAVTDVATTSSSSGSLSFDGPKIDDDLYDFGDQVENIEKFVLGRRELDEEGFSKEIGIVGIGGCGKTLVARRVFNRSRMARRIWINLQAIQKGEIDFKKILKAMLKQCDGGQRDSMEVEELLEALCKALWSKSYLLVFDGIWDINLDWYFRLKERLQWCNKSIQSRLIIITTRLHGVAKRMVGPNNLYRIQPLSDEDIWGLICENIGMNEYSIPEDHPIGVKMKDEMIYHSHGLPLAATTFNTIMQNQTCGGDWEHIVYHVMINPKDDANQGNDLLLSLRSVFWGRKWVPDISEVVPQFPLDEVVDRVRILVFGGDATTNRVLQAFCDMVLHPTPPIGVMPLGTQVNISISLGWGNQLSDTDSRPVFFLRKLRDVEEILIDR
ncbi:putative disease resistance protein RGA3 [Vitis vinifera]|uniref:Putative disease resistance protein RGA3 n=1 Tax=Vitis vinifera TaxID=29760 RepID=A0A438GBF1_VITVI|nr:putative disease resistance protein RGA3 [Vitis vinifera]